MKEGSPHIARVPVRCAGLERGVHLRTGPGSLFDCMKKKFNYCVLITPTIIIIMAFQKCKRAMAYSNVTVADYLHPDAIVGLIILGILGVVFGWVWLRGWAFLVRAINRRYGVKSQDGQQK